MPKVIRHGYLATLADLRGRNLIKVVTGARRVGKSTLLAQYREALEAQAPHDAPAIAINFDDPEYRVLAEGGWKEVYDVILPALHPERKRAVFLDEVQNVPHFEKLLEGLFVHPGVDLYVTGSNAYLLSSELATLLTGRAFEVHVLPFSFAEYLELTGGARDNLDRAFSNYVVTGGFPEAVNLSELGVNYAHQYLQTLYRNIYENDIKRRCKIHADASYGSLVNFLADSVGSPVSPTNIAKVLTSHGKKIDNKSVAKYISTLTDAYLFYRAPRYDVKGKQLLSTQEKYYLVDTGLRNALLCKELSSDLGHTLENVVYLELIRRKYQVWVGKVGSSEVDFVARDSGGATLYIQVSYSVKAPETLSRELAVFDKIPDHSEKILITADYDSGLQNGVKVVNAVDWILGGR